MLDLHTHTHGMTNVTPPPRRKLEVNRDDFRERIKFIRERLGLSKAAFAETLGLSKSNYGQVEAGNRMLTVDQIYTCFLVHGVPMEYLLAGQERDLPEQFR